MWGDMFRRSKAEGSILHDKLGIAPTPGSEFVLDRKTGKLVRCTRERCPYGVWYDDLGFVNSAPYAANGGWGAAISNNASPEKQAALADFFLFASSRDQSEQYVIPTNASAPWYLINGQDPFRKSQLGKFWKCYSRIYRRDPLSFTNAILVSLVHFSQDVDKWVARGFDRELSKVSKAYFGKNG